MTQPLVHPDESGTPQRLPSACQATNDEVDQHLADVAAGILDRHVTHDRGLGRKPT